MVNIGKYNRLRVLKPVDFGVYLDGGDGLEILLPQRYITSPVRVGDELDVFVYTDSEDRIIATTEDPYVTVGEFAFLRAVQVNNVGAFLDWGLQKDLLVPYREQKMKMRQGGTYLVYVYLDDVTRRVVASAKVEKFLGNVMPGYKRGQEVDALVCWSTPVGYKVIVDNLHSGMLYSNEIFRPIDVGDVVKAFVKYVRPDGKIDITLSEKAIERVGDLSQRILAELKENGGHLHFSDKSSPEEIKERFNCSKKDFKKAIGQLYKKRLVEIGDADIKLT